MEMVDSNTEFTLIWLATADGGADKAPEKLPVIVSQQFLNLRSFGPEHMLETAEAIIDQINAFGSYRRFLVADKYADFTHYRIFAAVAEICRAENVESGRIVHAMPLEQFLIFLVAEELGNANPANREKARSMLLNLGSDTLVINIEEGYGMNHYFRSLVSNALYFAERAATNANKPEWAGCVRETRQALAERIRTIAAAPDTGLLKGRRITVPLGTPTGLNPHIRQGGLCTN